MTKREQILVHEAGHLLYFLKSLENPKNLACVEAIKVKINARRFGGVFMIDPRKIVSKPSLEEKVVTGLGGMIADIHFHKLSYKQFIYSSSFNYGWFGDIQKIESKGVSWGKQRLLAWKLAQTFSREDEVFVGRIVSLFKDGRCKATLNDMLPIIRESFLEHRNVYSKNEQLKLFYC